MSLVLECQILTEKKVLFSGQSQYITLPAANGMMQVLPGHAESFVVLQAGEIVVVTKIGKVRSFTVPGGLGYVRDDQVVVLI